MVIQLDTKTVYSFMDSLIPIKKYVQKAKDLGYSHLGMMDVDNLYGAYHFLEEAESAGLQPLLGLDLLCRSEERRVGKECRSRWSPYH